MRTVLQRVRSAAVSVVDGSIESERARIGEGLLVLAGFSGDEDETALSWVAAKIADLRLFPGGGGEMDRSVRDTGGQVLIVSQFTLYGDVRKGRRPDFGSAARYEEAERLYDRFCVLCEDELPGRIATGRFGARMQIEMVNNGPVTLVVER